MNPLVSIIVPVYNTGIYLRQCIDSILGQTHTDFELLCVDDGSTDGSFEILVKYEQSDKRVKVFQKANKVKGAASGRNYGLERAVGKYLLFLDHDDFFDKRLIETLVDAAEKVDADIVMCDALGYNDATGGTKTKVALDRDFLPAKNVFTWRDYPEMIFQISSSPAWNCLFRREFVDKYNIRFQDIPMTDDMYFTFLARIMAKRITVVPENLVFWRMNTSINQTSRINQYPDSAYPAFLALRDKFIELGIYREIERSFLNKIVTVFRNAYDQVSDFAAFEKFHNQLKTAIFPDFGIDKKGEEYFHDQRAWQWLRLVLQNSPGQTVLTSALESAKRLNLPGTTAVLRF